MTIKKFSGQSREEAIDKAKQELGPAVVIMNVKEIRPKGFLGLFRKSSWEVTAALEDAPDREKRTPDISGTHFDAVAGEKGVVRNVKREPAPEASEHQEPLPAKNGQVAGEEELRDAFLAVNEVIRNGTIPKTDAAPREGEKIIGRAEAKRMFPQDAPAEQKADFAPAGTDQDAAEGRPDKKAPDQNRNFIRTLYNILLNNEVDEKYVNQILSDMEKVIMSGASLDVLLSNVYQKMVLMLGKPKPVKIGDSRPLVVFFIGPTGVGKTTTVAKIASYFKLKEGKKVGLITTDTYRIAAKDQLKVYANILEVPLEVVMEGDDINETIGQMSDDDLILVDTTGFSHNNTEQKKKMEDLLKSVDPAVDKEVYLVLSATTRYRDLKEIVDSYRAFTSFTLIFTKLDETDVYGSVLSTKLYSGSELSYVSTGQNVPDDIEVIDIQKMVRILLGGH